ncbi:hypothetical protein DFH94DRAFT_626104 [Russula ochroleuca]|uniref:Uncharacterized protein n=1 Tax=Russula ochroleuca TaxID=152965 RepID=A0A9P5TBQ5_9AGAM|nr:hypothetical protein DFH94DRAFT_626104 [Russula ochroleuca]
MDSSAGTSSQPQRRPRPTAFRPISTHSRRNSRQSSLFRSRLPADPFSSGAFVQRNPIVLNSERLYHSAFNSHPTRDVILVLGDPSPEDLSPLLNSERLAFSLLILASHQPPPIPSKVQPTIRILRLAEPLALEQAGAVRFVNVLEWAERVARTWRKVGGIGVREMTESDQEDFGTLTLPQNFNHQCSKSPAPSAVLYSSARTIFSLDRLRLQGRRGRRVEEVLPPSDPSQRPFDALVNYLPSGISDKSLLKHVILVTTITRPFLVAAAPPSIARPTLSRSNSTLTPKPMHLSTPSGSVESLNTLHTDSRFLQGSPIKAHLVHVLPARPRHSVANRLVDSIETFLLSFSFPPTLGIRNAEVIEHAHQCLLESATFAEPVGTPPSLSINWTMADILLSNCLDDQPTPRAWFSGASDIVVAALPQSKQSQLKRPKGRVEPSTVSSSRAPYPALNHRGINTLPTPPDSEEGAWYRRALPIKEAWNQQPWRLKFWKRPTETPITR